MPKPDPAHKETDKLLAKMEKELHTVYKQAYTEARKTADDFMKQFREMDKKKREAVKNGDLDKDDYARWRRTQVFQGNRFHKMADTLAADMTNSNKIAASVINGYLPEVYAVNYNYGTYEIEKGSKINTQFTLYDRQTVERLLRNNPDLLPKQARVNIPKDQQWNKKVINSAITQGILQGDSIDKIADRLAASVADMSQTSAIRNARTMTTSAQNGGRIDSYKRAENMGIKLMQVWLSTLDNRTRHEHILLDGQKRKVGEPFEVDGEKIYFPGDPSAEPYLTYNCRCTLIAEVKGIDYKLSDISQRENKLGSMTYEQWKDSKRKQDEGEPDKPKEPEKQEEQPKTTPQKEEKPAEVEVPAPTAEKPDAVDELTSKTDNLTVEDIDAKIKEWEAFSDNSLSLDDWAKAEEEIQKLIELKNKLALEEAKKKENEQKEIIKNRMIEKRFFDNGEAFVAQYNLDDISIQNLETIEKAYDKVFDRYPQLKSKFAGIDLWDNTNPDNAMAETNMQGGLISFNPKYWKTDRITTTAREQFENGKLAVNSVEGMAMHEIGHAIDSYVKNRWDIVENRSKVYSGNIKTTSENGNFMKKVYQQAGINESDLKNYISFYGTYNDAEAFAECFGAYMTDSKHNIVIDTFGKLFEDLMKGVL